MKIIFLILTSILSTSCLAQVNRQTIEAPIKLKGINLYQKQKKTGSAIAIIGFASTGLLLGIHSYDVKKVNPAFMFITTGVGITGITINLNAKQQIKDFVTSSGM